jgi:signal transduction histidine kinase
MLPALVFMLIVLAVISKFIIQTKNFMVSLQTSNMAKTSFLATISHEIKTPLNSIMGFTDILLNDAQDNAQNEGKESVSISFLKEIKKSSNHLMIMVHDILTMSKLESGHHDVFIEEVLPNHIIKKCLKEMRGRIKDKNLQIENICSKDIALSDAGILQQAFTHILSNAVKFTPDGGAITIKSNIGSNGLYHLYIIDTGLGMTRSEIEKALDLFSQLENVNTRISEGTGLGLSLVDRLMKRIGGSLYIHSTPGEGTSVRLSFPSQSDDEREERI